MARLTRWRSHGSDVVVVVCIEKVVQTGAVELAAAGVKIRTDKETAMLMKLLQQELAKLFLMKAKDPSAVVGARGAAVVSTVVTLLGRGGKGKLGKVSRPGSSSKVASGWRCCGVHLCGEERIFDIV
eukprot:8171220-Pyramimonas_sp.AAC.1